MYQFVASLFYSTLFCCGGKANLVRFTLFYSTLLALTHRQTDGQTEERIKKSSSRLSGGLCCCVSFWFWREIGSFFVVPGKFYYDRKKSSSRLFSEN